MSQRYFYLAQGKTVGPVQSQDIHQLIVKQRIGPLDQICVENTQEWGFVIESPQFKSYFEDTDAGENLLKKDYVILVKSADGKRWIQKGPYSVEHIRKWLQQGWLNYTDFGWTNGMKKWQKLGELEDFFVRPKPVVFDEVYPGEKLENSVPVVEQKTAAQEIPSFHKEESIVTSAAEPESEVAELTADVELIVAEERSRPQLLRKIVFLCAVVLVFGALIMAMGWKLLLPYFESLKDTSSKVAETPVVVKSPPIVEKPKEMIKPMPKKEVVIKPKAQVAAVEPTYLQLRFKDLAGKNPQLVVLTDGSLHYPIAIVFKSAFGNVLGQPWVEKTFVRERDKKTKGEWIIPMSKMRLPSGSYTVTATLDEQVAVSNIFVGKNDTQFRKQMQTHLKNMSGRLYEERQLLYKSYAALEALLFECLSQGQVCSKSQQRSLQKVGSPYIGWAKTQNKRQSLMFPELWYQLGEVKEYGMTSLSSHSNDIKKSLSRVKRQIIDLGI